MNLITGPNGSGKSNLYKALRLLAKTASGGVINSLAEEGGLHSTYWAGRKKYQVRCVVERLMYREAHAKTLYA
nr:AAA family ATPase [Enterovibrio nigricans]